ncbi:MAG: ABC transporter substrate-binding protein [Alphaproteobacteria bacterium]|nr:ABC transporter substrate-binding protein [Alphaproteobacteria bacterium]
MRGTFIKHCLAVLGISLAVATVAPAAEAQGRKFSIVIGSTSFAFFPIYVAHGSGFFKDEGLDVDIVNVPANATPVAAILSGNADIAGLGTQAAFSALDKGQPLRIVMPIMNEYTSTIFAHKDVLKQKGVSRQSPLKDRVEAMRGLKLASTAIGAGPHLMYKYLFAKYANGTDVDKVAEVVPIGNAGETLAGMQRGIVHVSAFSPPVAEKAVADGFAEILIDFIGGDVPEIKGSVYIILAATEEKLKRDPEGVRAFIRAMHRANQLAKTDLMKAGEAAQPFMRNMQSDLYGLGVKAIGPALPTEPTVSVDGLKRFMSLLEVGGYKYKVDYEKAIANDLVKQAIAEAKK